MIVTHEANTRWKGQPVGVLTDRAFFSLGRAAQRRLLEPFTWVEYRAPLGAAPPALSLQRSGFFWIDVQINFRIALQRVPDSPSLSRYECTSASQVPFTVADGAVKPFSQERYLELPGVSPTTLNDRYVTWANQLIARSPAWCLRLTRDGETEGWFLSDASETSVNLTLAMLATGATASGQHLYQRALREYAIRGGVIGHASFSIRNTPVVNIYSSLGAQFTPPTGIWMWVADRA